MNRNLQSYKQNREYTEDLPPLRNDAISSYSIKENQFTEFLETISDSRKLVIKFVLAFMILGISYIIFAKPIYRADVLVQVENTTEGTSTKPELAELLQVQAAVSEVDQIFKSRKVLGKVIENKNLDIVVSPVYFPVIGSVIARYNNDVIPDELDAPWFNMKKYAWSGESVNVERFDLPEIYHGLTFKLIAGKDNLFKLLDPEGKLLIEGKVGELVKVPVSDYENINLFVSEIKSNPGTQFELIRKARLDAINDLKDSFIINEEGDRSGILKLSLDGPDKQEVTETINEIAKIYLRQSVERKSQEAAKTLVFIEKQIPLVKEKMKNAEAALNSYRLEKGSVDLPLETRALLDKVVNVDSQISELKREREELIMHFTPKHPRIAALDSQIASLDAENKRVGNKLQRLPDTQQEILRLTRELELNTTLYSELLNNAQELKFVKEGASGNVRIIDYAAIPIAPVKPKKGLVIALTITLGLLLGVGAAFLRKSFRDVVQDPEIIERKIGLPVYATIPQSKRQLELNKMEANGLTKTSILAATDSKDITIESLRSLRTSLYFAQMDKKNNIIVITSPKPGAGKSFICVNLGTILADSGKKTLVIDADLRKGTIHDYFGIAGNVGLSDVIASNLDFKQIIRKTPIKNLDIILSGTIIPNPSELLLHDRFAKGIERISMDYDFVIVDSPPILAATDAAIIGRLTEGVTLLVVKHGQSPIREIEQSIKRLKHAGVNLRGAVFNDVTLSSSKYGYGKYYGHGYSYTDAR